MVLLSYVIFDRTIGAKINPVLVFTRHRINFKPAQVIKLDLLISDRKFLPINGSEFVQFCGSERTNSSPVPNSSRNV